MSVAVDWPMRSRVAWTSTWFLHPIVLGVVAIVALIARRPTLLTRPEFADEDGQVFYLGALLHGASSVFDPYAGYLHVAARLLALPQVLVPIEDAPLVA